MTVKRHTIDLAHLGMRDLDQVGGKNSSLGEMISHLSSAGVSVPGGFATTADSFREFLSQNGLDKKIYDKLTALIRMMSANWQW
ncbi:PEP/pyruvate-binding domain-containing protein [Legionella pneumophila]|nr:PEP/pyruvate-binding domain-containing protein [Legionella pneumophila]